MIIRILSLLALVASLSTVSVPVFAAEDEFATPNTTSEEAMSPVPPPRCQPWMHNCGQPPMRFFQCWARNALGRTFTAYGNNRTPRQFVAQQALQMCFNQSLFFIRNTCRFIGCR